MNLLELIITLCLVSILAQIATQNYQRIIANERRHEANQALLELFSALESYALPRDSYEGATLEKLHIKPSIANHHYRLQIDEIHQYHFVISATPSEQQRKLDLSCQQLLINSEGLKSISGNGTIQECWM